MNIQTLNVKAIVTGWLFGVIGSTAFSITAHAINLIIMSLIFNFFLTILAGYLTSSLSQEAEITNALAMGILAELSGWLFLVVIKPNHLPIWYHLVSLLWLIPLALFGSYLYLKWEKPSKV